MLLLQLRMVLRGASEVDQVARSGVLQRTCEYDQAEPVQSLTEMSLAYSYHRAL